MGMKNILAQDNLNKSQYLKFLPRKRKQQSTTYLSEKYRKIDFELDMLSVLILFQLSYPALPQFVYKVIIFQIYIIQKIIQKLQQQVHQRLVTPSPCVRGHNSFFTLDYYRRQGPYCLTTYLTQLALIIIRRTAVPFLAPTPGG